MWRRIIALLVAIASLCACSKVGGTLVDDLEDASLVKITLAGDYVGITSEPLTRASEKNAYYAFEIDSLHIFNHYYSDYYYQLDTTYHHYAEGLFDRDHISDLSVSLQKGHKYRIRCCIIRSGVDELYVDSSRHVYEPFTGEAFGYGTKALITNSFVYGGQQQTLWAGLNINNWYRVNDGEKKRQAELDRYFGETISGGETIVLRMERLNCGIHLLFNAPKEGTLRIYNVSDEPKFDFTLKEGDATVDEEHICALQSSNASLQIKMYVIWTKKNGEVVDLSPGFISFQNKMMTTIKVDINDRVGNSDIHIETDDTMRYDELVIN